MLYKHLISFLFVCLFAAIMQSCTVISKFSQSAYSTDSSIQARAVGIMDSATSLYTIHQASVNAIMASIDQAYALEQQRPKNKLTVAMWAKMKDTNGYLFGGYVARWQKQDTLSPVFIQNAKLIVDSAFSQILDLEKAKPAGK